MSYFFFFKQKTAYEMRISDWSSDVCSSDLLPAAELADRLFGLLAAARAAHPAFAALVEGFGPLPAMPTDIRKEKIGRASCRERGCQYVSIPVVAVSLKKKHNNMHTHENNTIQLY